MALIALGISACIGLLYMVIFIIIPKVMTYAAFVLAAIVLLVAGILLIVQPLKLLAFQGNSSNIIIGIILILVAIFLVVLLFCQQEEIELASIFLTYANMFLKENAFLFGYIPLFMVMSFGLFVLCAWQFIAFGSKNEPSWSSDRVFMQIDQNEFLQVLNGIEFVWGIQFIRDTCISFDI